MFSPEQIEESMSRAVRSLSEPHSPIYVAIPQRLFTADELRRIRRERRRRAAGQAVELLAYLAGAIGAYALALAGVMQSRAYVAAAVFLLAGTWCAVGALRQARQLVGRE